MTVRIAMHGASGRMGQSILKQLADGEAGVTGAVIGAALEHEKHPRVGDDVGMLLRRDAMGTKLSSALHDGLSQSDVVIDFSTPEGTASIARACEAAAKPLVVGTTGLNPEVQTVLDTLSKKVPVVVAPNMSIGVNVLFYLASEAARLLGEGYDIEIVEMHHRKKVDAPSGTAQGLYESVTAARGLDASKAFVHGRSGQVGARTQNEIGVMALRGGDVVGDHTVVYAGDGERIELTHRAHTREIFAQGAVKAALWVVHQRPGRYTMMDVLGIQR